MVRICFGMRRSAIPTEPRWKKALPRNRIPSSVSYAKSTVRSSWRRFTWYSLRSTLIKPSVSAPVRTGSFSIGARFPATRMVGCVPVEKCRSEPPSCATTLIYFLSSVAYSCAIASLYLTGARLMHSIHTLSQTCLLLGRTFDLLVSVLPRSSLGRDLFRYDSYHFRRDHRRFYDVTIGTEIHDTLFFILAHFIGERYRLCFRRKVLFFDCFEERKS